MYFNSDEYMSADLRAEVPFLLRGSAICLNTSWVPCPTCDCSSTGQWSGDRCGHARSSNGTELTFILKNNCDGAVWEVGIINYVTMVMVFLATLGLGIYLRKQEVKFDEDEQTAQDYSIVITNPPPDATDPEEWRRFFKENCDGAEVTVCTCAVDNDFLVRTLVERREKLRIIESKLEPGISMNILNLAFIAAKQERERKGLASFWALLSPGIPELFSRVVALNAKVQGLAQLEYPCTNVFVTFETEKDQRHVLSKLSVGSLKASRNDASALEDPKYLFRGKHVLAVSEADEPNTVRWQDLNAKFKERLKQQVITVISTLVAIITVAVVVFFASRPSNTVLGAAIVISGMFWSGLAASRLKYRMEHLRSFVLAFLTVFNSIFPMFAKFLTDLEFHSSEGKKQASLYFKISAFRWVNTAIVITIITPFTDTLIGTGGLIAQIYAIFFADLVTSNAIQLADPVGHLKRHILAPRAATQDAMNLNMQGQQFELAER